MSMSVGDEEKILLHLKHSQQGKTFADLMKVCGLPRTAATDRILDNGLKRMKAAGLIEFNRKTKEWEALVGPTSTASQ